MNTFLPLVHRFAFLINTMLINNRIVDYNKGGNLLMSGHFIKLHVKELTK